MWRSQVHWNVFEYISKIQSFFQVFLPNSNLSHPRIDHCDRVENLAFFRNKIIWITSYKGYFFKILQSFETIIYLIGIQKPLSRSSIIFQNSPNVSDDFTTVFTIELKSHLNRFLNNCQSTFQVKLFYLPLCLLVQITQFFEYN